MSALETLRSAALGLALVAGVILACEMPTPSIGIAILVGVLVLAALFERRAS